MIAIFLFSSDSMELRKNIDFRIEPGKVVSIVGPNGAGKSSLLNVISGNVEPSSGESFYNNVPLKEITIMERAAIRSVMGQHNHVVYDFTVQDILEIGWISQNLSSPNKKRFESNLKSISEECYLTNLLDRKLNKTIWW